MHEQSTRQRKFGPHFFGHVVGVTGVGVEPVILTVGVVVEPVVLTVDVEAVVLSGFTGGLVLEAE
jgi:hypothetical protein